MLIPIHIQFGGLYEHCGKIVRVVGLTHDLVFYVYVKNNSFSRSSIPYFLQHTIKLKDQRFINKF